ncbi:MAG: ammonia-forming cytochrome c nitrite reductase subunit c552 [Fidelibacterota bacterium]
MKRLTVLMALFTIILFVFMWGCEKEVEKIVTPEPVIKITSLTATPDSVGVGKRATLIVVATTKEADTLIYRWEALEGTFTDPENDTTEWIAPDKVGLFDITVHVTDMKENAVVKSILVGVETYVPSATPYYKGAVYCAQCHDGGSGGDQYTKYVNTKHADAWEDLMTSEHASSYCYSCHTVGYDATIDNGGYDESEVDRLTDVQCENCHGPGSDHPTDFTSVSVSEKAELCGSCHTGDYHPTYDDWSKSGHNFDPSTAIHGLLLTGTGPYCAKCHEGEEAMKYLSDPSAYSPPQSLPAAEELLPLVCATCHDPHDATNEHQLRTVADITLVDNAGETPVITSGGAGKLCMQCHHARRSATSPDQINEGYAHFGPHENPQTDMLFGESGYELVDTTFIFRSSGHNKIEETCVKCHMNMIPYTGAAAVTGHEFEPTPEACAECHGSITAFTDIIAKDDYDGNGVVEPVMVEVDSLLAKLKRAVIENSKSAAARDSLLASFSMVGDTTISTLDQRKAAYNWFFVNSDGSHGVHNPVYAIQLLQQSYELITGSPVPGAVILKEK